MTDCTINLTRMYILQPVNYDVGYILCGPVLTTVIVTGLLCNSLSLLIFCQTLVKPKIYLYLIALTLWDLLVLISSCLLYSLPVLLYGRLYIFGSYVPLYPFIYTSSNISKSGSTWTIVVLAVERYFALCHPMKYITWNSRPRSKLLLLAVSVAVIFYHMPNFFEISIFHCMETTTLLAVPVMDQSSLRKDWVYQLFYKIIGGVVFFSIGPLLIMIILTVRVSLAVKESTEFQRKASQNKQKSSLSSSVSKLTSTPSNATLLKKTQDDNDDRKMDFMLIAIMVKFCVSHLLPVVLDLCETSMSYDQFHVPVVEMMVDVSNVLVVVDSSYNFVVYFIFGVNFRRNFKRIFINERYSRNSSVKSYHTGEDSKVTSV